MSTLTISIPDDLHSQLREISKATSVPAGALAEQAIRRHATIEKFLALRSRVMPLAAAQGFVTDEDVFKAIS